ncbi:MAG TPA: hypothetical protein PLV83_05565 [Bacilli bacterium]|nr:hypothetical protein [Bacilli bacterium]
MNVKGKLPTSGTLILNNECSVTAVNASDGTFTATLNNGKVEIANGGGTNNSNKICTLKSGEALAIGSEYECDPGDGKKRTFYVLEDGDAAIKTDATPAGSISLIMDRNIDNTTVAWSADGKSHKDEDESAQAITVKA